MDFSIPCEINYYGALIIEISRNNLWMIPLRFSKKLPGVLLRLLKITRGKCCAQRTCNKRVRQA